MDIDTIVQGKIDADTAFQASIAMLPDADRDAAIATKRKELTSAEFKTLADAKEQNERIARDQKLRAEKAEQERDALKGAKPDTTPTAPQATPKDIAALVKADVHEDDYDEVFDYAKYKNIPVAEALKSDVLKVTLEKKAEHRRTAAAANTGTTPPGPRRLSDAELLAKYKDKAPEPGTDDADRLFWLRRGGKPSK